MFKNIYCLSIFLTSLCFAKEPSFAKPMHSFQLNEEESRNKKQEHLGMIESKIFSNPNSKQIKVYKPSRNKITKLKDFPGYFEFHWQNLDKAHLPYRVYLWKENERRGFPLDETKWNYYSAIISQPGSYFLQITDQEGLFRSIKIRFQISKEEKSSQKEVFPRSGTQFVLIGAKGTINFDIESQFKASNSNFLTIFDKNKKIVTSQKMNSFYLDRKFKMPGTYYWTISNSDLSKTRNLSDLSFNSFTIRRKGSKDTIFNQYRLKDFLESNNSDIIYLDN